MRYSFVHVGAAFACAYLTAQWPNGAKADGILIDETKPNYTNAAGNTITGSGGTTNPGSAGVYVSPTITNSTLIFNNFGTITTLLSGSGVSEGIEIVGASGLNFTLNNVGLITNQAASSDAIRSVNATNATLTINNSGIIQHATSALYSGTTNLLFNNSGTVQGSIWTSGGPSTIFNQTAGSLTGTLYLAGATSKLDLSGGAINGNVVFAGSTTNQLKLSGGIINGTVSSSGANMIDATVSAGYVTGGAFGSAGGELRSLAVTGGTLAVGHSIFANAMSIANGAGLAFASSQTLTGNLSNAGTIAMGAGTTGTIAGNYTQTSTGALTLGVNSPTSYGKLSISGSATLPTFGQLNLSIGTGASFTNGALLSSIISADAPITSTFQITDDSTAYDFAAMRNGNSIDLKVYDALAVTQAAASVQLRTFQAASPVTPVTSTGGVGSVTYAISPALPAGLVFDTATGQISGTPTANSAQTTYTVTATDSGTPANVQTSTFSMTIVPVAPIPTVAVPSKTIVGPGAIAAFTPVTFIGGAGALTYSVSPALPAGLTMNAATGQISGTPTALAAARSYTVTATDASTPALTGSASFTLDIQAAMLASTVAVPSQTATALTALTAFRPVTFSGGTGALTYSILPALPAGLTFDTATGQISGTATGRSPQTVYAITATDAATPARVGSGSFTLTVNAAPLAVTVSTTNKTVNLKQALSGFAPVQVIGGTGAMTYAVSPTLPAGLVMNTATGVITGTPTQVLAPTSFTVTVRDSATPPAVRTGTFSLAVEAQATTLSLSASTTRANSHQPIVLTATISAAGAAGTVTFHDKDQLLGTAALASGTATLAAKLPAGSHVITATYEGQGVYSKSVSNALSIESSKRSDPSTNPDVRGLVAAQAESSMRMSRAAIGAVANRLERLHDDVPTFENGINLSALPTRAPALAYAAEEAGRLPGSAGAVVDRIGAPQRGQGADAGAPRPATAGATNFGIWTAGSVLLGQGRVEGGKFSADLAGVAAGVDTRLLDGVKAGAAVSLQRENTALAGSARNAGQGVFGSVYGSWNVYDRLFLDGTVGYGQMRFLTRRWDGEAGAIITGERPGGMVVGSVGLSWDQAFADLRSAPYVRLEASRGVLGSYTETGSSEFDLAFRSMRVNSQAAVLGWRGDYTFAMDWGALAPSLRAEYRWAFSGSGVQSLAYADTPTEVYGIVSPHRRQGSVLTAFGLRATLPTGLSSTVEYLYSTGSGDQRSQGVRGAVNVPF